MTRARSLSKKSAHLAPAADASPCGRRPLADNPAIGFGTVDRLARSSTDSRRTASSSTDSYAANAKRVPTLFWMNASGSLAAIAWIARQPVQWHGTT